MLSSGNQKGFIQLGIIGVIVLAAGLFVASKLASNPDLSFFDISEEAAGVEEANCKDCSGQYELRWNRDKRKCVKRQSLRCRVNPKPTSTPAGCYYKEVQCIKAPCESVLICPTPTPTPKYTPTPYPQTPTPTPVVEPVTRCSCYGASLLMCTTPIDPLGLRTGTSINSVITMINSCPGGCTNDSVNGTVCHIENASKNNGELCRESFECKAGLCSFPPTTGDLGALGASHKVCM